MPISTSAQISFPLDIPQVDVLATRQRRDGKFIITVESHQETVKCGVCQQSIPCNYGQGQEIQLRHTSTLLSTGFADIRARNLHCHPAPPGTMPDLFAPSNNHTRTELV